MKCTTSNVREIHVLDEAIFGQCETPYLQGQGNVAIRLNDIDWQSGEIQIHSNGARRAAMLFPVDIGLKSGRA